MCKSCDPAEIDFIYTHTCTYIYVLSIFIYIKSVSGQHTMYYSKYMYLYTNSSLSTGEKTKRPKGKVVKCV